MKIQLLKILTLASLLTFTHANAGIIGASNNVEGISDISFSGDLYTANFIDSACGKTFDFCGASLATDITAANGQALTAALLSTLIAENLDTTMSNIAGINEEPGFDYEYLIAPFQLNPNNSTSTYAWRLQNFEDPLELDDIRQVNGFGVAGDLSQNNVWGNRTVLVQWVKQTPITNPGQSTSVPEPTTLAIFALGLFGLVARRKMHK